MNRFMLMTNEDLAEAHVDIDARIETLLASGVTDDRLTEARFARNAIEDVLAARIAADKPLSYSVTVPVVVSVMLVNGEFDVGQPLIEIDLSSLNADGDAAQGVYDEDEESWSSSPDNADIADAARKKVAECLGLRQPEDDVQANLAALGDLTPPEGPAFIVNGKRTKIVVGDRVTFYRRQAQRTIDGIVVGFRKGNIDQDPWTMEATFVLVRLNPHAVGHGSVVDVWADEVIEVLTDPPTGYIKPTEAPPAPNQRPTS